MAKQKRGNKKGMATWIWILIVIILIIIGIAIYFWISKGSSPVPISNVGSNSIPQPPALPS